MKRLFRIKFQGRAVWTYARSKDQAMQNADFRSLDLTKYKAEGVV